MIQKEVNKKLVDLNHLLYHDKFGFFRSPYRSYYCDILYKTNAMKHIMLIAITFFPLKAVFSQNKEVLFNPSTYVIPDSITIANGTKISKEEFFKIFDDVWNVSLGQMNSEDKKLFEGVEMGIAIPKDKDPVEPEN